MRPTNARQDQFFLWGMIFLPILSLCAYIFDAYFYYYHALHTSSGTIYEGLISTIVLIFAYLQYCAPISSRRLRCAYHLFLWLLNEVGHVGYLLSFIYKGNILSVLVFVGWIILDTIFTAGLIYCRVYRKYDHFIEVENKHIFHFISRLEVILAIFIPVFTSQEFATITRDNIAFFLLFDFFSETYVRFNGIWIKSSLYLFVTAVTVSVASEWLYFRFKNYSFEYTTEIAELVAGCFCYAIIIMQFFTRYFKQHSSMDDNASLKVIVYDKELEMIDF